MNMSVSGSLPPEGQKTAAPQVAALCWRKKGDRVEVMLITSRETGRWVIPKGWPMDGLTPSAAAEREAWEEAGVTGTILKTALGEFHYDKITSPISAKVCAVAVYCLQVKSQKNRFPEAGQRRRVWFAPGKAAELVAEPELRQLLTMVADRPGLLMGEKPGAPA